MRSAAFDQAGRGEFAMQVSGIKLLFRRKGFNRAPAVAAEYDDLLEAGAEIGRRIAIDFLWRERSGGNDRSADGGPKQEDASSDVLSASKDSSV